MSEPAPIDTTDPDAAELSRLLGLGDFGLARRKARALLAGSPTDAARAAARDALDRTGVDPLAVAILIGCVVLFVVVIALTVHRSG